MEINLLVSPKIDEKDFELTESHRKMRDFLCKRGIETTLTKLEVRHVQGKINNLNLSREDLVGNFAGSFPRASPEVDINTEIPALIIGAYDFCLELERNRINTKREIIASSDYLKFSEEGNLRYLQPSVIPCDYTFGFKFPYNQKSFVSCRVNEYNELSLIKIVLALKNLYENPQKSFPSFDSLEGQPYDRVKKALRLNHVFD